MPKLHCAETALCFAADTRRRLKDEKRQYQLCCRRHNRRSTGRSPATPNCVMELPDRALQTDTRYRRGKSPQIRFSVAVKIALRRLVAVECRNLIDVKPLSELLQKIPVTVRAVERRQYRLCRRRRNRPRRVVAVLSRIARCEYGFRLPGCSQMYQTPFEGRKDGEIGLAVAVIIGRRREYRRSCPIEASGKCGFE